jgi:hypothetical protein
MISNKCFIIVAVNANVSFSLNYKNEHGECKFLFKRKMFLNSIILMLL